MKWHRLAQSFLRVVGRLLGIIVVIGLTAFLYLSIHGVPRRFVNHGLAQLRSHGYCVTVERIRLDLLEGVVAERFRAFEDKDRQRPMLEADRVALFLNPLDWLRHKVGLRRLRVYNGCLRLELTDKPALSDTEAVVLHNINGELMFSDNAWNVNKVSADLLGLEISCRGRIRLGKQSLRDQPENPESTIKNQQSAISHPAVGGTSPQPVPPTAGSAILASGAEPPVTHRLADLTRSQRERLLDIVKQLNAIEFSIPPHATIIFQLDMDNSDANEASIRVEGAATRAFGLRLDRWRLQAELNQGQVRLTEAIIQQQRQYLACSGSYTFAHRTADARLHGRLILKDWLAPAPQAWRDVLDTSGVFMYGPIQCDIRLDPAPVDQTLEHLHGWLALARVDAKGLWIEQGYAGFTLGDNTVSVDPFYMVLGKGAEQGPVQGHGNYAWDTGDYEGSAETRFDPRVLMPLLGSNLTEYANALVFNNAPLVCNADFSGRTGRFESVWIAGDAQVSNFTCNATPITSAHTRFDFANHRLAFDNLRMVQPEGEITGRLSASLEEPTIAIDLVSTANPQAIAGLIGPEVTAYLDGFYFAGPIRIAVRGTMDYATGERTDIQAELDGHDWGYHRFHVTHTSMKAAIQHFRFDVTDIRGEAFEGTFSGNASLYPDAVGSNFFYHLSTKVDDVNLNTLLQELGYQGQEDYEGIMYSECVLAGAIGQGHGNTATGGGWIRVQDGQLFQLRLLGGFSRLLSVVYPGLGTVNLTDVASGFSITNQHIITTHTVLSGPTLAIHGEGYCAFDGHLDFIVWAQTPHRSALLPRFAQATAPIFNKLLAVRLTGTATDPKWWPLNLTKDQLMVLPKDLLVDMPKNVLIGLPHDLLVTLPREVLVTLPRDLLIELPKKILVDLPEEVLIKLPQDIWQMLKPARSAPAKPQ